MKSTDVWVNILYTYGPFAILVFLIFVAERKSRTAMKGASGGEKKTLLVGVLIGVYVLNWIAIFSLVIFSVYAWKQLNLDTRPTISGYLMDGEKIGLALALLAFGVGLYHLIEIRKVIRDARNHTTALEEVRGSLSTRYICQFPQYYPSIVDLVGRA